MSSLDVATDYADRLVERERRATGKLDVAMDNVAAGAGLSRWTVWGLWHRRRKTTTDEVVGGLRGLLIRQIQAEIGHLEHEVSILIQTGARPDDRDILAAQTTLAKLRSSLGLDPS
jgi:hypothetical protein